MNPKSASVALLVAGVIAMIWFCVDAGFSPRFEDGGMKPAATQKQIREREPVESTVVVPLAHYSSSEGRRNVFAYPAPPAPPREKAISATAPVAVIAAAAAATPVVTPESEFRWKYIGRFGPDANPLAVFVANRDVVSIRTGELIGEFRLNRIGIESVDVASASGSIHRVSLQP